MNLGARFRAARHRWLALSAAIGVAVSSLLLAWYWHHPERLTVVVSAIEGEAFSDGVGTRQLGPRLHVPEGQRLRTSAGSTLHIEMGAHRVDVGADSGVVLESLRPRDLRLRLERGSVTLTVEALQRGERVRVFAGELSVEVIGAVLAITHDRECSEVSVRSGRVVTSYRGTAGEVCGGDDRRFCKVAAPVPPATPSQGEPTSPATGGARDGQEHVSTTTAVSPRP